MMFGLEKSASGRVSWEEVAVLLVVAHVEAGVERPLLGQPVLQVTVIILIVEVFVLRAVGLGH